VLVLNDAESVIKDSLLVNDTSSSQQIATGELHISRVNITF